jgi:hypothetical protein
MALPVDVASLFTPVMLPATQQLQAIADAVDCDAYETADEAMFAAAVAMVSAYARNTGQDIELVLGAITENLFI